jgi:CheY-like chemotaxis protein
MTQSITASDTKIERQLTAFVIEDDYDASTIYATALQMVGYQTEVISSGDAALARLQQAEPDLIVLDLHLPHVEGSVLLHYIRNDQRLRDKLVFIASADPLVAESLRHQADLTLIKPVTFSQVRDFAQRFTKNRL